MADLTVTIGADASQYNASLRAAAANASSASNAISQSLAHTAKATEAASGSALSYSMRLQQMRSGLSTARDGLIAFTVGGQGADRALLAAGHHFTSLINETGSLKGAFSALGSSLWGPGGVILGVSLAYELYQKLSEGTKEAAKAQKDYVDTIGSVRQAQLKGQQDGQQELTRLQILYNATQDHTLSLQKRNEAYDELEKRYPKYFTNAEREKTLLGENKTAYNELAQAILSAAAAKAYEDKIGENSNRAFENSQKVLDLEKKIVQARADLSKKQNALNLNTNNVGLAGGGGDVLTNTDVLSAQSKLNDLIKQKNNLLTDSSKLSEQNRELAALAEKSEADASFKQSSDLDDKNKKLKAQKDGFAALQQQIGEFEKQLQDALIAGSGESVTSPLSAKIIEAKSQLEKLKAEFDAMTNMPKTFGDLLKNSPLDTAVKETPKSTNVQNESERQFKNIIDPGSAPRDLPTFGHEDDDEKLNGFQKQSDALLSLKLNSDATTKAYKQMNDIGMSLTKTFGSGLTSAFESVISGTQSFTSAMGQFLGGLITKLIAAAAAAALLAIILSAVGLGAGLGGAASSFGSFKNLLGSFSGVKMATGGITNGPTRALIGEGSEKEAVMPLSKLRMMIGAGGNNNSGDVKIVGVLQGSNLLLQQTRATKQRQRIG